MSNTIYANENGLVIEKMMTQDFIRLRERIPGVEMEEKPGADGTRFTLKRQGLGLVSGDATKLWAYIRGYLDALNTWGPPPIKQEGRNAEQKTD